MENRLLATLGLLLVLLCGGMEGNVATALEPTTTARTSCYVHVARLNVLQLTYTYRVGAAVLLSHYVRAHHDILPLLIAD